MQDGITMMDAGSWKIGNGSMLLSPRLRWLYYGGLGLFVALNCLFFAFGLYWFALLPVLILTVWLLIYHPEKVLLLIAIATPFSQKVSFDDFNLSLNMPTEPLMILFMGAMLLKLFIQRGTSRQILRHPITLALLVHIAWLFVTSLTSSMPIVSFKFLTARLWFITCFYFGAIYLFRKYNNVKAFFWLFSIGLSIVILNTLKRMAGAGWEQHFSSKATGPFFTDHGVYAAVIALVLPTLAIFFFYGRRLKLGVWQRFFALVITFIFSLGIIFSFTRATWISIGCAAAMFVILNLRIKFSTLFVTAALLSAVFFYFKTDIYVKIHANKQVSASDLEAHLKSISNITTDDSNTERINRWNSAWRMFLERPMLGWGPATYMFQYAPFQRSYQMTKISTNAGTLGNSHSEYMGPLAETGAFGFLNVVFLFVLSIYIGMKLFYKGRTSIVRMLAMGAMLGLITYFTHGILNDYLDTDKASVPFWSLMAVLTCLDLYNSHNAEDTREKATASAGLTFNYPE